MSHMSHVRREPHVRHEPDVCSGIVKLKNPIPRHHQELQTIGIIQINMSDICCLQFNSNSGSTDQSIYYNTTVGRFVVVWD